VSCFHGHLNKCPLGDLNKCPLGDLNKSPWENYLEGGGSEEIIKSTRFCKVHYVLNSDIKFIVADWKDKVDCGIGLSYQTTRLHIGWRAGTTTLCHI
jgi:hypothetical protein